MSIDDDIVDSVLEGSSYEQAQLAVRRTFGMSIDRKIRLTVVALASAAVFGPAVYRRRGFIRSIEMIESVELAATPRIGTAAILGILTAFSAGLLLVRQKYVVARRSLSADEARRLVRIEDLLMWFVLLGGAFIAIPVAVAVVGLVSTGPIERLYEYDIVVYRPAETVGIDARLVSVVGAVSAAILFVLQQRSPSIRASE